MSSGQESSSKAAEQAPKDNRANQCNPKHPEYRGHQPGYTGKGNKADLDNHARQLDPKSPLYKPNRSK